jgi:hypothetical protein
MSAYVSIRPASVLVATQLRVSAYERQHTAAYVSIRQHTSRICTCRDTAASVRIRPHTSAYVSIRQHTSAYVPHLYLSRHSCRSATACQCLSRDTPTHALKGSACQCLFKETNQHMLLKRQSLAFRSPPPHVSAYLRTHLISTSTCY